jgi:hypothetical protein
MTRRSVVVWCSVALVLLVGICLFINACLKGPGDAFTAGRGQGVIDALSPYTKVTDQRAIVVSTLVKDYQEDRSNAVLWSMVYWGCVFLAAAFSAIAALILKFESLFRDDKIKKDVASALAVVSAILVTLSSSGRFSDKWQANRLAAAELESVGYEFLKTDGENPLQYYEQMKQIQYARQVAIIGKPNLESRQSAKPISTK